jgi:pentatricopeptide repeat protein
MRRASVDLEQSDFHDLMHAFAAIGFPRDAIDVLEHMESAGFQASTETYNWLLLVSRKEALSF